MAFKPAAVNLSAQPCPASSRRQIGAPGFASISQAKPSFTSLALTLLRAAPLIVAGADKQWSLRCAAALIITSCASVSLTLMIQPFSHPGGPGDPSPHQDEPRIGQCRWGGWVTRARRAVGQRHQCFLSNEKPVLPAWGAQL